MAVEDWLKKSPEELIKMRYGESAGTPSAITIDRILELRNAESQANAADQMLRSTDNLVEATRGLRRATWWLVGGTLLLGTSAAVDVILKIVRGSH